MLASGGVYDVRNTQYVVLRKDPAIASVIRLDPACTITIRPLDAFVKRFTIDSTSVMGEVFPAPSIGPTLGFNVSSPACGGGHGGTLMLAGGGGFEFQSTDRSPRWGGRDPLRSSG